jgi:hypothetical protein
VEFSGNSGAPPAAGAAWLVRTVHESEPFGRFLAAVDTTAVTHLILGCWELSRTAAMSPSAIWPGSSAEKGCPRCIASA